METLEYEHELVELDASGDSTIGWNPRNQDEVEVARRAFDRLKGKGYLAYSVNKAGEKDTVIREFDPEARRIIMSKPSVGG